MPGFGEHRDTFTTWAHFPALERIADAAGTAHLTFDDGPDADATPAVLDELEAAGIRCTFFLVADQLARHPELGHEISRRGHEIALHGFDHPRHDEVPPERARDDVSRGLEAVEAGTGVRPRFFRPPYGRFADASYEACRELGLEPVYWSSWGTDWEPIPAERIADLVSRDLEAGAIAVLHDSPRYAPRSTARPTAEAVPLIADAARERGLRLLPLGEGAVARAS